MTKGALKEMPEEAEEEEMDPLNFDEVLKAI